MKFIRENISILFLTLRCYFQGDSWIDALWYAKSIVKSWRIKK